MFQEFLLGDCTKAKEQLGWKTEYDLKVTISAYTIFCLNIVYYIYISETEIIS